MGLPEEREIIPRYLRGERGAVRTVDDWIEVVLHREFRSLRDEWDDLQQEMRVRVLACLRAGRFNGGSALRTYVHRIARNAGIDYTRKAYRHREKVGSRQVRRAGERSKVDGVAHVITRDLLMRILDGVSARDRLVVEMVFAQHLSYVEVAEKLDLTEGAVKSLVFRCRSRLLRRKRELLGSTEVNR